MPAPGTPSALEFAFIDEWALAAEADRVWSVLRRIDGWPEWWPSVRSVVPLPEPTASSPRWEFTFRTRLPYSMVFDATLVREEPSAEVEWQVTGRVAGRGICGIRAVDGGTFVWWDWLVSPQVPWMRFVSPVARPVFSWNHKELMDEGAAALAGLLGTRLLRPPVSELRPPPRA
ncbi:MAG TPA: SRPBCC family protein [Propionibacteriaceae bacterium]|nr:SRPBCC family protein [Propionibacteriaceae bacterium]